MELSEQLSTRMSGANDKESRATLAGALSLSNHIQGRATKAEANYTDKGPEPFQCGNCKYILWGNKSNGADLCQLVSGDIRPDAACRLFDAKPDYKQQGDSGPNLTVVGTYSANPPVDDIRSSRLKPSRLLWRRDRWGWNDTGEPRSE